MVRGVENASARNRMEQGFFNFFQENELNDKLKIHTLTINSTDKEIIFRELTKYYLKNNEIKGVFVTNSKAHMVSDFHLKHELDIKIVGFDLVDSNIEHLKLGGIDYIISQSPMQQGLKAVQVLFDLFIYKNIPLKVQHVPLDIIIKENVDFYVDFS
jgi:LacI family transcriptional regulator